MMEKRMEGTGRPAPSLCILPEDHRELGGVQRVPACTRYVPTPLLFEGVHWLATTTLGPDAAAHRGIHSSQAPTH